MNTDNKINPSKNFLLESDMPWEQIDEKLSRQIVGHDDSIMMVKVKFKEGGVGQMHEHYHAQVTYVVHGTFEMTIGDEVKTLKAGDSFYIPPHTMHGCTCTAEGMLIDVFSPHREDFMDSVKS